ncbi:MAG: tetratricopeptide repeat protein [Phycisphaerae bacterium]|nr:tetratricopeptide repeat protein [Phycisphaerae bacterium]
MAADNAQEQEGPRPVTEADKAAARQWFSRAKQVLDTRNYDYAIECFINGLDRWPTAVEEGHKPLLATALFRAASGGKKPGRIEAMKRPTGGKDPHKAMLNAEFLMAKDPKNADYLEALFRNAAKALYDETVMWAGPVFLDAAVAEKKPSPSRFRLLSDTYAEVGERHAERKDMAMGVEAYERAVRAMMHLRQVDANNLNLGKEQTDLATRLTILKGQYQTAGSFRESVRDGETQRDIRDTERVFQADDRLDELVAKARAELAANPEVSAKVFTLVDLLCKREDEKYETEAIDTLLKAYRKTDNYRMKMRADDIRIRQLNRQSRQIVASGDREAAKAQFREQLKFELRTFRERVQEYPTDLRIRFEYGKRLFKARNFDEAIPVFQEARSDPKNRTLCSYYIGRCFFEKGYFDQAFGVLSEALERYELQGDATSKDLSYWLGRTHESAGQTDEAMKVYGRLLEWDYNFKDVRARMDNLRKKR